MAIASKLANRLMKPIGFLRRIHTASVLQPRCLLLFFVLSSTALISDPLETHSSNWLSKVSTTPPAIAANCQGANLKSKNSMSSDGCEAWLEEDVVWLYMVTPLCSKFKLL